MAVLGLGEALHELAVLVGDHHGAQVGEAGVQAGLGGQTAHITGHSLQTLLRLDDSLQMGTINNSIQFDQWEAEVIKNTFYEYLIFKISLFHDVYLVHVHHPLNGGDLGLGVDGLSLPPHAAQGHVGGEQEEEAEQGQQGDDDGGQVEASLGGSIGGGAHAVTLHRGAVSLGGSSVSVGLGSSVTIVPPDPGSGHGHGGQQGECE